MTLPFSGKLHLPAVSRLLHKISDTLRQFAEEALADTGTADDTRDRHAQYFADQSDIAFERLTSEDERLAYRFVDTEITNLTTAFRWALTRELADPAARIAANTHLIARNRLQTETYGWPEQALDLARRTAYRQLPHLLAAACDAATSVSRFDDAVRYGFEAITLNDDDRYDFTVHAYWATGLALFTAGDVEHGLPVLRVGAAHPADAPAEVNLAYLHLLAHFGGVAMSQAETIEALDHLTASPVPTVRAGGLWVQALVVADDDALAAIALCQQALDADTGSRTHEESVRGYQLGLISRTDDVEAALAGFSHVIDTFQATMGDNYTQHGMGNLVAWLARLGYHDGAARLCGAVEFGRLESWSYPPEVLELREIMGEEAFIDAFQAGAVLGPRATGELAHQLLAQVRSDRLWA